MSWNTLRWFVAAAISLAAVPMLLVLGAIGFGSADSAAHVVDTLGVWVFSWALVAVAIVAALALTGLALSTAIEALRSERA